MLNKHSHNYKFILMKCLISLCELTLNKLIHININKLNYLLLGYIRVEYD